MNLSDLEFIRLLPEFMKDDDAVKGLSKGIDEIIPPLSASLSTLSTWDHIDSMGDAELDELAWELNIQWYDTGADIGVKRELIKNSDMVYRHLGTKWAVENVITTYFGEGYIEEWFEYGGEPGRFRVYSTNPDLTQERLTEFLNVLNKVKRASAKLENILVTLTCKMPLSAGVAVHEMGHETYDVGVEQIMLAHQMPLSAGVALHEVGHETYGIW